jgi:acetyl-CoA carboxylase carboxyltransferase component
MHTKIYSIIILASLCLATSGPHAASVYLWTDDNDRMHITDEKPVEAERLKDIIEYEPGSVPQAAGSSDAAEPKNRDEEAECRNVFEARRALQKSKSVAVAVRSRAEEARDKVKDLRDRIGFDDDRRDDFKDDLKRLEENARRAEMFAQQAEIDVQVTELQVNMAELEAGDACLEKRGFY